MSRKTSMSAFSHFMAILCVFFHSEEIGSSTTAAREMRRQRAGHLVSSIGQSINWGKMNLTDSFIVK